MPVASRSKIPKKEDQKTEFKEIFKDDHLRTFCAFANSSGGMVYFGVADDGQVKGVQNAKTLLEDLPKKCLAHLKITPQVTLIPMSGKDVVAVKIAKSSAAISYKSHYTIRSGSTNHDLEGSELQNFLLERAGKNWEDELVDDVKLVDLETESLSVFKKNAKEKKIGQIRNVKQILERLNLLNNEKFTRAAVLLFSKRPDRYFAGAYAQVGLFSLEGKLLSSENIYGNALHLPERIIEIIKTKYLVSTIKIESLYRSSTQSYPEVALREAIVNAVAHKNYAGPHIQIKVYPDRMSIWNPGSLPLGLTIPKLAKDHRSYPRNQNISKILHDARLMERWGSGTTRIFEECSKMKLPPPVFEEIDAGFQVTFFKSVEDKTEIVPQVLSSEISSRIQKHFSSLEKKLKQLDKKLESFDPDEDIKIQFSEDVLRNLLNSWLGDLVLIFVPVVQKFNRYFINSRHYITLLSSLGGINFLNEKPETILAALRAKLKDNQSQFNPHNASFSISTSYGSFIKGGLNTFGCNYQIEIKFSQDWYEVMMDDEVSQRRAKQVWQRQYHKPLTQEELLKLSEVFGELIYKHLQAMVERMKSAPKNGK